MWKKSVRSVRWLFESITMRVSALHLVVRMCRGGVRAQAVIKWEPCGFGRLTPSLHLKCKARARGGAAPGKTIPARRRRPGAQILVKVCKGGRDSSIIVLNTSLLLRRVMKVKQKN